jgi:hypothetical protein
MENFVCHKQKTLGDFLADHPYIAHWPWIETIYQYYHSRAYSILIMIWYIKKKN